MITTTQHGKVLFHTPEHHLASAIGRRDNILHVTFGRMNPFTNAHLELLLQMEHNALMGNNSQVATFLSTTQDQKNPLDFAEKRKLIDEVVTSAAFRQVGVCDANNLFDAMDKADRFAYSRDQVIVWWVGSDRLDDAKRLWLYPERWTTPLVCIAELQREEDDERSATAMRAAALNSDYKTFERLAGVHRDSVVPLFEKLRSRLTDGSLESKTKTAK